MKFIKICVLFLLGAFFVYALLRAFCVDSIAVREDRLKNLDIEFVDVKQEPKQEGGLSIFGGQLSKPNEWPWLVAFVNINDKQFFCGGSLISVKHVLSAAHCFLDKLQTKKTPSQHITAFVGKHNLNIQNELGSSGHEVFDVILHPDWNPITYSFDADAALVVLQNPVVLRKNIVQIISLSRLRRELTGSGIVVGWGKSERSEDIGNDFDYTPNKIKLPVVSQSKCFEASKDLQATASNRTFCAGFINQEKAVCVGDSGSGFYQYKRSNRRYELAGIVSASVKDPFRLCEIDMYSLFTSVVQLSSWIDQQMEETKEIKWKDVDFYCNMNQRLNSYTCIHNFIGPMTRNLRIRHQLARNVQKLSLNFGESLHIFAGIGETFPSLEELSIVQQQIKFIEKENFIDLVQLEKLDLGENEIELLPENVFEDMQNLKILKLSNNWIRKIPEQIFINLKNLKVLMLQNNKISYLPENLLEKNTQLIEFNAWGNSFVNTDVVFAKLPNMKFHRDVGDKYFKGSMKHSSKINFIK